MMISSSTISAFLWRFLVTSQPSPTDPLSPDSADAVASALPASAIGVILVDHGSRRAESNRLVEEMAAHLAAQGKYSIVEPAHMELASPTIAEAFARCVARGARYVIVHPYFLGPGRHFTEDIPRLANQAAANHVEVRFAVTQPLGPHPLLAEIVAERIESSLAGTDEERPA